MEGEGIHQDVQAARGEGTVRLAPVAILKVGGQLLEHLQRRGALGIRRATLAHPASWPQNKLRHTFPARDAAALTNILKQGTPVRAHRLFTAGVVALATGVTPLLQAQSSALGDPWDSAGRILKTPGTLTGGYYRYNLPRRDLTVRVGDVTVAPSLALGAWAGFSGTANDATVMGDLVVTAQELSGVLAELSRQRIPISAIHNHLVGETPGITYVHFHVQGPVLDVATRLARVVARTATPLPVEAAAPPPPAIDTALVFRTLGAAGRAQGNIAQVSFVLVSGTVTAHGHTVTPALGYGTPINIQMVDATRAVATGDFAVLGGRVAPLLDAMATNDITATAVHSHLIDEQPTVYYIHFWADGPLQTVVRGIRAVLDAAR